MKGKPQRFPAETADIKHFVSGLKQRNDHYLHAIIDLDAPVDIDILKRAVFDTFAALPLLRCRFVYTDEKAWWEDAGWTEADMIHLVNTDNKTEAIQQQLTVHLNEQEGPQIALSVIRGSGGDTLTIVMNHMVCDGGGIRDYLYLLASSYTSAQQGDELASNCIPPRGRRSFQQVFDHLSTDQLKAVQAAAVDHYPQSAQDHLPLQGDPNHPFLIHHRIPPERFLSIKNRAKRMNATINDALFAAYICAIADVLSVEQIVLDCPVNARAYLPKDYQSGFCNLTTNIICAIPAHHGECFDEALKSVKKVMDEQKDSLTPLKVYWDLDQAYDTLPLKEAINEFTNIYKIPINGMTNIGILDAAKLCFGSIRAIDASISGSIKYAPYFQIAVTTFNQAMTFSTNFHGTEKDYAFLDGFVKKMISYFPE
ncbi:MAG: condensation domain-containing protein [Sporolactobacillus sp.]